MKRELRVSIVCRPRRMGVFLPDEPVVDFVDKVRFLTGYQGGRYSVMLPHDRKVSVIDDSGKVRKEQLSSVLIAQYDPDVLVHSRNQEEIEMIAREQQRSSRSFDAASIFEPRLQDAGIPIAPVIESFIERELKFQRVQPLRICLPEFTNEAAGIGAFLYGAATSDDSKELQLWLGQYAEINRPVLDLTNLLTGLETASVSLIDLSSYGLQVPVGPVSFCLVDHDNSEDLQYVWNARASGDRIIPWPRALLGNSSFRERAWDVASRLQDVNYAVTVETTPRLEGFQQSLIDDLSTAAIPRAIGWGEIGKPLSRHAAKAAPVWLSSEQRVVALEDDASFASVNCLSDGVKVRNGVASRFINVVQFAKTYSGWPTEVIPAGAQRIAQNEFPGLSHYRATSAGLVFDCYSPRSSLFLPVPDNVVVIQSFLNKRNIKSEISDKGSMLNQFVLKATGLLTAAVFTSGSHIELLQQARTDATISLVSAPIPGADTRASLLRSLAASDLVSLGVRVKCAACARNQWFGLSNLDDVVSCPFCQSNMKLGAADPSSLRWAYRVRGALANIDSRNDVAASVLAARYLDEFNLLVSSTIAPAMLLKFGDGTESEVDLIALMSDIPLINRPSVVFAECKSKTRFEPRDFDRLRRIDAEVPGCFLMLAANRERFFGGEKKKIVELAATVGPNRIIPVTINEMSLDARAPRSMARTLSELAAEMYHRNVTSIPRGGPAQAHS